MLKYFTSFLLCLLFTSSLFSEEGQKLREECLKPTISLRTANGGVCSAFVVRSELVGHKYRNIAITACHCTRTNKSEVWIGQYDKKGKVEEYTKFPLRVYDSIEKYDLAVIIFESNERVPVAILGLEEDLEFGMAIFKIGFGLGDDARLDEGKITLLPNDKEICLRTNAYTIFGDSGGPLFNKNNKVVGVCHGIRAVNFNALFHQSYFIPITLLKTWNDEVNNSLGFVYNQKDQMPVMAFTLLRLKQFEVVELGVKDKYEIICPPCCIPH